MVWKPSHAGSRGSTPRGTTNEIKRLSIIGNLFFYLCVPLFQEHHARGQLVVYLIKIDLGRLLILMPQQGLELFHANFVNVIQD